MTAAGERFVTAGPGGKPALVHEDAAQPKLAIGVFMSRKIECSIPLGEEGGRAGHDGAIPAAAFCICDPGGF
jgi:hypothetical protein